MASEEKAQKLLTLGVFEYAVARMNLLFQRQEEGKGLSQNDFTNELKSKLEHIDPDLFATADEVDEVLDQYFPGDVDPDEPPNENGGEGQQEAGSGEGEATGDGPSLEDIGDLGDENEEGQQGTGSSETTEAGAGEDEATGDGPSLDDIGNLD